MLAESVSRIRHQHFDAGIHFHLSENRFARLRHSHHSIPARQTLSGAEIAEGLFPGVPKPWNFLRERGQSDSARHREGMPTRFSKGHGRIQLAWRNAIRYRGELRQAFHSFFKSIDSRSSSRYSQK